MIGPRSEPVTYVFWVIQGSDHKGNGVVQGDAGFILEALTRQGVQLQLDNGKRIPVWFANVKNGIGEGSFYTDP